MGVLKDLRGRRFGRLLVKHFARLYGGHAYWCCKCECGEAVRVRGSKLLSGRVVSCGCQRANPDIRRNARLKVPSELRHAIAEMGGKARSKPQCRIVEPRQRRDYGLTVTQAAEALGVDSRQVWSMMDQNIIAFREVGNGQVRLSRADIEALVERIPPDRRWKKTNECS